MRSVRSSLPPSSFSAPSFCTRYGLGGSLAGSSVNLAHLPACGCCWLVLPFAAVVGFPVPSPVARAAAAAVSLAGSFYVGYTHVRSAVAVPLAASVPLAAASAAGAG